MRNRPTSIPPILQPVFLFCVQSEVEKTMTLVGIQDPVRMLLLSVIICFASFLHPSVSNRFLPAKPKPVDINYSCLRIVSELGGNDDVPIILIHGLASGKETWSGVKEVLAFKTLKKVCVVDLRNHGESPWSNEVDVGAMAEDIIHLLDKLEAKKAVLVGHSMGGKTAVHVALNYPERVDKLIVEDMRPNGLSDESFRQVVLFANVLNNATNLIPQGVTEKEAKEIFQIRLNERLKEVNSFVSFEKSDTIPIKCLNRKCQWTINPALIQKLLKDIKDVWIPSSGRFDKPTLFIYGMESDFKVEEDERNIKELFPNAQIVGVKGAGHGVHGFPEFVNEAIKLINGK
ncbi:Protein ABHD11 [Araneus ventricosus]|uniref:sn-1-specific diacylglycerol lipase ABHD11 n=1 Tax=Araneus ventricosus TaxID=182803 RepID=A0A4Y1ZZY7_ARAVE|nr:Protein ABHD11 [Araneus ventricosus]